MRLIGRTEFLPPDDVPWDTDATGGQALAEFAGRACYQSWSKPIPATATNAGYLDHILQVGHLSVLEHSTATFYITGISRSVTHELIRHRHFSFSQLSQRYLPATGPEVVEPAVIAADPALHDIFTAAAAQSAEAYTALLTALEERAATAPDGTLARKQARQAARAVLPNATSTAIVVTGNYRAWRWPCCRSCKPWRPTSLPTFESAGYPTAPRSPPRRWSVRAELVDVMRRHPRR